MLGRKPAHQRITDALRKVLRGELPKSVVDHADQARGLHAQMWRLCLRVYETSVRWRAGMNPEWLGKSLEQVLADELGFVFPQDGEVARKAIRRGKKYAERPRRTGHRRTL